MPKENATPKPQPNKILEVGTPAHKFMLRVESQQDMIIFMVVVQHGQPIAWSPQQFEYVVKQPQP